MGIFSIYIRNARPCFVSLFIVLVFLLLSPVFHSLLFLSFSQETRFDFEHHQKTDRFFFLTPVQPEVCKYEVATTRWRGGTKNAIYPPIDIYTEPKQQNYWIFKIRRYRGSLVARAGAHKKCCIQIMRVPAGKLCCKTRNPIQQ